MPTKKEQRKYFFILTAAGVIMWLMLGSAASAEQDVMYKDTRPMRQVFDVEKENESAEKEELEKAYLYDPRGKTDPFQSFIAVQQQKEAEERRKPRTYLETLDLSQLRVSVIVISPKEKWAMVNDPKGLGHVIREGTAIGINGGLVHQIQAGEVIIREEFKDFRGKKQFRDISKKPPSAQ